MFPQYSPCRLCGRFLRYAGASGRCAAFDEIPQPIWRGLNPHLEPYAGDQGYQFTRIPSSFVYRREDGSFDDKGFAEEMLGDPERPSPFAIKTVEELKARRAQVEADARRRVAAKARLLSRGFTAEEASDTADKFLREERDEAWLDTCPPYREPPWPDWDADVADLLRSWARRAAEEADQP